MFDFDTDKSSHGNHVSGLLLFDLWTDMMQITASTIQNLRQNVSFLEASKPYSLMPKLINVKCLMFTTVVVKDQY